MALPATMVWEIRPASGNAANGGGFDSAALGMDFSRQDSPEVTYTDLAIDGTDNTKVTSAANPFTADHVGNIVNITSGTGFTVGRYWVNSVISNVATLDRAVGTVGSTGGNGRLGGAVATINDLYATGTTITGGNKIWLKAGGTHALTASRTLPDGQLNARTVLEGYISTRGDIAGKTYAQCHDSKGFLDTTDWPVIDPNGYGILMGAHCSVKCLVVSGSRNNILLLWGSSKASQEAFRVRVYNSSTGSGARSLAGGDTSSGCLAFDCDLEAVSDSSGVAFTVPSNTSTAVGCRAKCANGSAAAMSGSSVAAFCTFYDSLTGITIAHVNTRQLILHCTFDGLTTCISAPNSAQTSPMPILIGNQASNCTKWFDNLYAATTYIPVFAFRNRLRLVTTPYTGVSNSAILDIIDSITDANDYEDVANNDFDLVSGSASKGVGLIRNMDLGALQRAEAASGGGVGQLIGSGLIGSGIR